MKQLFLSLVFAVFTISSLSAQQEFKIDTSKSELLWKGFYLFQFSGHEGFVKIKSGQITKTNNKLSGGSFVIDMNTIANTDGGYSEGLVSHLKNEDFFDVRKHPEARLKITKVEYESASSARIFADLTIKGITQDIEFQANMDSKSKFDVYARFKIDRTRWGITFNYLKDGAISDAIEFEVGLVLK
jgi:polyisoprenoid-binding protein YceI